MKKLLTLIVILLITLALIAPKFAGNTFNQELDNYIAAINKMGVYKASIIKREQGWFSTVADIQIILDLPISPNNTQLTDWKINLQTTAQHGPVLTQSGIGLGWLDWAVTLIVDELPPSLSLQDEGPIYQSRGKMGLLGGTSYQDRIVAMTYIDPTMGMVVSIDGWQGSGHLSENSFVYQGGPGNLRMNLPTVYDLEVNHAEVSWNVQASITDMLAGKFYDGTGIMSLKQLKLANLLDNSNTQLDNLLLESKMALNQNTDLADASLQLSLASMTMSELALSDMVMSAELNNLQQAFFKAYQQMNKEIMQSPERAQHIMQQTMQAHLLGQLQAAPEFNLSKFNAVVNSGNMSFTSHNKLVGVTSLPDDMESNDFWIQHMQSDTQMQVDEAAALFITKKVLEAQLAGNPQLAGMQPSQLQKVIEQQSTATLQSLLQQGLVIKTKTGYAMSFTLQNGKATLNNDAIPLPIM
jgi:hypothetical protein